jgi:hypothetical protein
VPPEKNRNGVHVNVANPDVAKIADLFATFIPLVIANDSDAIIAELRTHHNKNDSLVYVLRLFSMKHVDQYVGSESTWNNVFNYVCQQPMFSPFMQSGRLVTVCLDGPSYMQAALPKLFACARQVREPWKFGMYSTLRRLRNTPYLRDFVECVSGCPMSVDVVCAIICGDINVDTANCEASRFLARCLL